MCLVKSFAWKYHTINVVAMERAFDCQKNTPTVCFCCTCLLILRAIPKCLKHPAGPRQKLMHGRDIELQKNYCNFSEYSSYNKNLCSLWPNTEACTFQALNTLLVCFLHLAGAVLPNIPLLQRIKQLILRTIRQQICTNKQICTFESFGQKDQKLSQVQIYSPVQERSGMVHKTSCFMRCNWGNGRQDSPCWVQTAHKSCGGASITQVFVFG